MHLSITSCLLTGFKMSGTRETKIATDVSRRPVPQNEKRRKKKKAKELLKKIPKLADIFQGWASTSGAQVQNPENWLVCIISSI